MSSAPRKAALLVRISDARDEDTAGVDRQEADGRRLADQLGWEVAEVYVENDTSAYKRRRITLPDGTVGLRTVRPEYRRLLDDLATVHRDGLIGYDLDRVVRDPRDLEDLIDVVEQHRIPSRSVTGSLDLSSDAGIAMARVMVAIANKSSRDTARRVIRKHEELATAGRVGGGGARPFGYERDGMTVIDDEAAAVRAMAVLYLEGRSLSEIGRELDGAGVRPVGGGLWNPKSVSTILKAGRTAGLRVRHGEIVGRAAWPGIVDRDTWDRVQLALAERVRERPAGFQRWLTGCLFCGRCGHRMRGWSDRGNPIYWCPKLPTDTGCGRVAARAVRVEEHMAEQIVTILMEPGAVGVLNRAVSTVSADDARTAAAADQAQLKELAGLWGRRLISMPEYLEARKPIQDRLAESEAVVKASFPSALRTILAAGDIPAAWAALAPMQRREVTRGLFPHGIRIMPATRLGPVFDPDRIQPVEEP